THARRYGGTPQQCLCRNPGTSCRSRRSYLPERPCRIPYPVWHAIKHAAPRKKDARPTRARPDGLLARPRLDTAPCRSYVRAAARVYAKAAMAGTIIYENRPPQECGGVEDAGKLWLPVDELARVTGWELRQEGVCRGETCVPLPLGRQQEFLSDDGRRF